MSADHTPGTIQADGDGGAPLLGTLLLDDTGTIRWANRSVSRGLGYREGELIGLRVWEIDGQIGRGQWPVVWEELLSLSHSTFQTEYVTKDGRSIPVQVTVQALPYRGETMLAACAMDLTRLVESERARQQNEELYRVLAENSDDVILVLGEDLRIRYTNATGARYLQCAQSEMIGQHLSSVLPPECTDRYDELSSRVFSTGKTQSADLPTPLPDGPRWFNVRMAPLLEDGSVSSVLVSATDITRRCDREQALKVANQKLNMLSSVLRHDALNYLFALRGYHDLMDRPDTESEEAAGYLKGIDKSITDLERVLTFSREYQDLGVNEPRWQSVKAIVDTFAVDDEFQGVPVEFRGEDVHIYADPLLNRVLFNLLENAVRHADGLTCIRVQIDRDGESCSISISDDGSGIPDEEKERIFDRKFGKHTGFGLYLAREILAITGIGISETGRHGVGARFVISVPPGTWRAGPRPSDRLSTGDWGYYPGARAKISENIREG
ncbi:MAG: PAS domain-containing protein [Methanomicrobiales archaeon]